MEGYTEIFAWGGDHFGQLGLGSKHSGKTYSTPRFCSFNIIIKELACGEEHSSFISQSGHVYSMGSNSEGRLGLGDRSLKNSPSPCLVEGLSNYRSVKISCGWGHSAVITEEGYIFTWGVGEFGALGSGSSESAWEPVKCLLPRSMRGLEVSCGSRHTALIVDDNRNKGLLMCGSGEAGQLGTGKREKEFSFVSVYLNEDVLNVAAGVFHSLVLSSSGKVLACGGNSFGQLGVGNKKSTCKFEKVQIDVNIVKIAAGSHSAAISDKGQLFIWGTGVFGEYMLPTRMSVGSIKDVDIGGSFGIAVDVHGSVFAWGANTNGELGNGDFEAKIGPSLIGSLKGKTVRKVRCGGNYVLALGLDLMTEYKREKEFRRRDEEIRKKEEGKIRETEKYRTSSLEVQKGADLDKRKTSRDNENDKLSINFKVMSQRFEDARSEARRLADKNGEYRIEVQRLQRELDDKEAIISRDRSEMNRLQREIEENRRSERLVSENQSSLNQLKALNEELKQQNYLLTQDAKSYKDEIFRLKRAADDSKLSAKLEFSQHFEELNSSIMVKHSSEVKELQFALDQEFVKRKQIEKSLDVSNKHISALEESYSKVESDYNESKRQLQERNREFESHKFSLQQEVEKYYKENSELRRKLETALSEKQRSENLMKSELSCFTNDCSDLQVKLEKLALEKDRISGQWKADTEKYQLEVSESRRRIETLLLEKEKTVKSLQTEIFNLGVELGNLKDHLDRISLENKDKQSLLQQKSIEIGHYEEDLSSLKTEISYYKQANEELKYQISKFHRHDSENAQKFNLMQNEMQDFESNYKNLVNENKLLKETVCELEDKNRQLFDNLEKELAQRAKEYKERTILMLNTPNRSTSPYLRPTTPMTHTRDKSDDIGNTAAKLLDAMDSPKSVRVSQYLTVPQMCKESTTPTKEDVRTRIANLMKNRSRIEEQLNLINNE